MAETNTTLIFFPIENVPNRNDRMIQQHPRTSIPHHGSDLLPFFRSITVDRTLQAGRLLLPVRAEIQPLICILLKLSTFITELPPRPMVPPAVYPNHCLDGLPFTSYPNRTCVLRGFIFRHRTKRAYIPFQFFPFSLSIRFFHRLPPLPLSTPNVFSSTPSPSCLPPHPLLQKRKIFKQQ